MFEAILFFGTFAVVAGFGLMRRLAPILTFGGAALVAVVVLVAAGASRPRPPAAPALALPIDAGAVEASIAKSEDVDRHRVAFIAGATRLAQQGACSPFDIENFGGWMRAPKYKPREVYFVICKGSTVKHRYYVDAATGETFQAES